MIQRFREFHRIPLLSSGYTSYDANAAAFSPGGKCVDIGVSLLPTPRRGWSMAKRDKIDDADEMQYVMPSAKTQNHSALATSIYVANNFPSTPFASQIYINQLHSTIKYVFKSRRKL